MGTGMDWDDYNRLIAKAASSVKKRSSREERIEQALGGSMPGILRRLLNKHNGRIRPALRDLNDRLDEAGVESNVSPNTFYNLLDKYRLR